MMVDKPHARNMKGGFTPAIYNNDTKSKQNHPSRKGSIFRADISPVDADWLIRHDRADPASLSSTQLLLEVN